MIYRLFALLLLPFALSAEISTKWSGATEINQKYTNAHKMDLVYIPAGKFMMGSPEGEPYRTNGETIHEVTLTQSFLMGTTEVTQEQFQQIMGVDMQELIQRRQAESDKAKENERAKLAKLSATEKKTYLANKKKLVNEIKYPGGPRQAPKVKPTAEQKAQQKITQKEIQVLKEQYKKDKKAGKHIGFGSNHPVGFVSWSEAVEFCQKLTEKERGKDTLPKDWVYRLPTDAEWEYACRAGSQTPIFTGKQPSTLDRKSIVNFKQYAWSNTNSGNKSHAVAQLKASPWGLYDIYGNVSEWTLDIYAPYTSASVVDPLVLKGKGMMRVNRGLNSHCTMTGFRSAHRKTGGPKMPFYSFFGLRVVCAPYNQKYDKVPDNHSNR
ncbi:MAG: formylglycine-generating enzyme family protein [Lentisphaeraceae bacterium]|nr:formylglycine-generating enzyme family protein [Lentisphaeraceae bacterium]